MSTFAWICFIALMMVVMGKADRTGHQVHLKEIGRDEFYKRLAAIEANKTGSRIYPKEIGRGIKRLERLRKEEERLEALAPFRQYLKPWDAEAICKKEIKHN